MMNFNERWRTPNNLSQIINEPRRTNDNIFPVKDESSDVKSLLSLSLKSSKHDLFNHINYDMNIRARRTKRKDLIRTALLLATSRNTEAQENLIEIVSTRIGRIKDKEYHEIAKKLSLTEESLANKINDFLCLNIEGYATLHNKHYTSYYSL